jgi:integrase
MPQDPQGQATEPTKSAMHDVAGRGRLPRNVAEGIKLSKVQRKEMHFLTAAQVETLADAIVPPYGVLIRTCCRWACVSTTCGTRRPR